MKSMIITFAAAAALTVGFAFAQEQTAEMAPVTNAAEVAEAQVEGAAAEAEEGQGSIIREEVVNEWVRYIQQGGRTMWFIGLLSVLGLGCALERLCCLRRSRISPKGLAEKVVKLWGEGQFDEIARIASKNRSALARVVETLLEHRGSTDVLEVKAFAEDKAGRELRLEGRKATMLATVATLAPLLGLFGTVLGLLEAFGTVAAMGEMGDASVLADSIGKALVTTVAGLAVAMPALFVHQVIRGRLALYSIILEEEIADVVRRTVGAGR